MMIALATIQDNTFLTFGPRTTTAEVVPAVSKETIITVNLISKVLALCFLVILLFKDNILHFS